MSIHYFFAHGLVIFIMLTIVVDGFSPTWKDYIQTIIHTSILVIVISTFNFFTGSNYMFTRDKPPGTTFAELMPDWPYYFIIMLIIGLIFYTLLILSFFTYKIFINRSNRSKEL